MFKCIYVLHPQKPYYNTTIVDRQFKEDRTLCPVRALMYYLNRTQDLRGS